MYNSQGPESQEVIIAFSKVIKEKQQEMLNKAKTHTAREKGVGMQRRCSKTEAMDRENEKVALEEGTRSSTRRKNAKA